MPVISTHQVGMVLLVYGVGSGLREPVKQSNVYGVCLEMWYITVCLWGWAVFELSSESRDTNCVKVCVTDV